MAFINPLRHLSVFDPEGFGDRRIDIVGVGATGSRIALSLAKLGIKDIHVWDFDKVEEHNIPNQMFDFSDIGSFKVDAMKRVIEAVTGTKVTTHNEKVDGTQAFGEVVFLLTDTMSSRKEIWKGIKLKLNIKLMIETRMGTDTGMVYAINPCLPSQIKAWEGTLCDDKQAVASACGGSVSVGPTADMLAGLAVWQMIKWYDLTRKDGDPLENEVIYSLRPMTLLSRAFKS